MIPGNELKAVVAKVFADQTVFTAFINAAFLSYATLAAGIVLLFVVLLC